MSDTFMFGGRGYKPEEEKVDRDELIVMLSAAKTALEAMQPAVTSEPEVKSVPSLAGALWDQSKP